MGKSIQLMIIIIFQMIYTFTAYAEQPKSRDAILTIISASLENITTLERPNQDGLATIWDGNKFVQCRALSNKIFRCEAAGILMQPSLSSVLTTARVQRLAALGWEIDPSFGNWVHIFPSDTKLSDVSGLILKMLIEGYDVNIESIEVKTDWVYHQTCMPRIGPKQNLAGNIVTSMNMIQTSIRACNYVQPTMIMNFEDLQKTYQKRITGEVQRLRINVDRNLHFIINTDFGYIQCVTSTKPDSLFCEAASAFSWAALESILTPQRISRLHELGYIDPGKSPNYSKFYVLEKYSDTEIAHEVLSIFYEVYGYHGSTNFQILNE